MLEIQIGFLAGLDLMQQEGHQHPLNLWFWEHSGSYLGRGWTFDDIEENTGISQETHRQFFHALL